MPCSSACRPFAHGAPERAAITRGLPFFVEKPVTLDMDVAEADTAEVAERGLATAVGYHWRYLLGSLTRAYGMAGHDERADRP